MPQPKKSGLDLIKANFWLGNLLRITGAESPSQLPSKLNSLGARQFLVDKDAPHWRRYSPVTMSSDKAGKNKGKKSVPSDQLIKNVEQDFPGSQKIINDGPYHLFSILEAESLDRALFFIQKGTREIQEKLREDEVNITGPDIFNMEIDWRNQGKSLDGLAQKILNLSKLSKNDEFLSLAFGISHTEARLLGHKEALIEIIIPALTFFDKHFKVPFHAWRFDIFVFYTFGKIEGKYHLSKIQSGITGEPCGLNGLQKTIDLFFEESMESKHADPLTLQDELDIEAFLLATTEGKSWSITNLMQSPGDPGVTPTKKA